MTSAELREVFLSFFEKRGHTRVRSSPLVPVNDPTLFFTNAGMVQFKDVFTGDESRSYKRACTSQKCMRVSGKHNDLENVGHTPRHHTFFEMLGNFSFGDYFKEDAIAFAWELLTNTIGLDGKKMIVTIFKDDDEAEKLWRKHVPQDRIFRLGEKDNFWSMGDTGPCGPCSEILWDRGKGAVAAKDLEGDRFMEIWNLVFMQFNRASDGTMTKLKAPSIDTGMGLERLASVVQGVASNWETDLFVPLIRSIEQTTKRKETEGPDVQTALRVIADHARAGTFLIADGVLPSNEGRGYVLRRILRRGVRYARKLGITTPILAQTSLTVISQMGQAYPELVGHQSLIEEVLKHEEVRFLETIDRGIEILDEAFVKLDSRGEKTLAGDVVFKLSDTYGFPKDLTELIADERGFVIDDPGFEREMEQQRTRARSAWKGSGAKKLSSAVREAYTRGVRTRFVGYEHLVQKQERPVELIRENQVISKSEQIREGEACDIVVATTPFYAEGGGQVGDCGRAVTEDSEIRIVDTQKPYPDLFVHHAVVERGALSYASILQLMVDADRRQKITCHHTATHLINAALRQFLGTHVKQAGSYLDDQSLRFDFSHFAAVTDEQLADIELLVNRKIQENLPVTTQEMAYPDAIKKGALAFFGEKYGDIVRVVEISGFSTELCGGTHVNVTGEIGRIKIIRERSVASGVRRIEAVSGDAAVSYEQGESLRRQEAKTKEQQREVAQIAAASSRGERIAAALVGIGDVTKTARDVQGIKVVTAIVTAADANELRDVADICRQRLGSGVVVLGANVDQKAALVAMVSKDLTTKVKAGEMIQKLAPLVGGKGGGRPDMAQGGGPDVSGLDAALKKVSSCL
ncbi:MAG: alanine--tRNA ligase [Deltaproteobacteria bacterium]|nr:alanine--tRNA ligase [Deltaproteobacteria bacterium]